MSETSNPSPPAPEASKTEIDAILSQNLESNLSKTPVDHSETAPENIAIKNSHSAAPSPGWERATLEKLAFAALEEQKTARRWKNMIRLAWLAFFCLLAWMIWGPSSSTGSVDLGGDHTAVVAIQGEIMPGADASSDAIVGALKNAFEEDSAKAIVLLINSPGGSPVQAGIINDEIRRLKAAHKKPVYAVVEETCASAAYYIAVAADDIYVDKASIVGSIGVLMDSFGFTGLMEKLGVERRLLTAGENKGFMDPFSPQSPQHKQYAQAMLAQVHKQFIDTVKAGRGAKLKETPEMFSGLFWSGQQAVELGLADHLGNLDYVAREIAKAPTLVDYTRRDNVAERLAKRFGAAMGEGAVKAMRGAAQLR